MTLDCQMMDFRWRRVEPASSESKDQYLVSDCDDDRAVNDLRNGEQKYPYTYR